MVTRHCDIVAITIHDQCSYNQRAQQQLNEREPKPIDCPALSVRDIVVCLRNNHDTYNLIRKDTAA